MIFFKSKNFDLKNMVVFDLKNMVVFCPYPENLCETKYNNRKVLN